MIKILTIIAASTFVFSHLVKDNDYFIIAMFCASVAVVKMLIRSDNRNNKHLKREEVTNEVGAD